MTELKTIISTYTDDLLSIQEIIDSKFISDAPQLSNISRYLSDMGGKKVRPLLAIALAKALGLNLADKQDNKVRQLLTIGAGIEMIHMATLLHDDIIDRSLTRRHKPSAYSKFGLEDTLLTGDFLLVRAFGLCSKLELRLIDATESACVALTEGEILEKKLSLNDFSLEQSINIAQKKTAALFELATFSATYLAQADESCLLAASEFGRSLGIGFQIVDDILDVISEESVLGKPSGQDLREQKPSVINLFWLETGSKLSKNLLGNQRDLSEEWVAESLAEIRSSEVPARAKDLASGYFNTAKSKLAYLAQHAANKKSDSSQHFAAIDQLVDFALSRMV